MMTTLNETPSVRPAAYAGQSPAMWRYGGIGAILAIACILPFAVSGFLVGSVVGGIRSISGVFIGALFIEFTPNFADQISKAAPDAIFGIFLIALMYLMPKGAIGILDFTAVRLRRVAAAKRQN